MPITPFIGVRISWLMFARNWLLAALAISALDAISVAKIVCFSSYRLSSLNSFSACF